MGEVGLPAAEKTVWPPDSQKSPSGSAGWTLPVSLRQVLVVENDTNDARIPVEGLARYGYSVQTVRAGREALDVYRAADMVLLDLDLPDLDGLEVCRLIRTSSRVPIIVVSARTTELDRVLGLRAGADDYMSKPCLMYELIARMDAVMRRARRQERGTEPAVISCGPLTIEPAARKVCLSGKPVKLTRKEFDLLHILAAQPRAVVSRKYLMERVWGDTWSRRTIDTHVSSLRGKLGDGDWIVTVRGVGFQIGPQWWREAVESGGVRAVESAGSRPRTEAGPLD